MIAEYRVDACLFVRLKREYEIGMLMILSFCTFTYKCLPLYIAGRGVSYGCTVQR